MCPHRPHQTSLFAIVACVSILLVSCASTPDDGSSTPTAASTNPALVEPSTTRTDPPTDAPQGSVPPATAITVVETAPGSIEIVETLRIDDYYGACGNQILDLENVTWYPVIHEIYGGDPFDELPYAPVPNSTQQQGLVRVPGPEAGDDIGNLYVYADGIGRFISDSGKINLWMTTEPQTYMWAC